MTERTITREERGGSVRLWIGLLTGPAAWSIQMIVGYNLEEIACRSAATSEQIMGAGIKPIIISLTVVLMLLTAVAGALAYGCLRRAKEARGDDTGGERAHWMAYAGIVTSGFFEFILLLGLFPSLFLSICEVSP